MRFLTVVGLTVVGLPMDDTRVCASKAASPTWSGGSLGVLASDMSGPGWALSVPGVSPYREGSAAYDDARDVFVLSGTEDTRARAVSSSLRGPATPAAG